MLIAGYSFYTFQHDLRFQNWSNAAFAAFNGLLTTYAIVAFIGLRNAVVDVVVGMANWVRVPVEASRGRHKTRASRMRSSTGSRCSTSARSDRTAVVVVRRQGGSVPNRAPRTGERRSRVRAEVSS